VPIDAFRPSTNSHVQVDRSSTGAAGTDLHLENEFGLPGHGKVGPSNRPDRVALQCNKRPIPIPMAAPSDKPDRKYRFNGLMIPKAGFTLASSGVLNMTHS